MSIQSLLKVLVVIILIVNEAKVTSRSSEVSHILSKEAVGGLMRSLLPLFIGHASPEQSCITLLIVSEAPWCVAKKYL